MDSQAWKDAANAAQKEYEWNNTGIDKITSMHVGAIMGLDPYNTREDVMRRMVRSHHGADSEFVENIVTDWSKDYTPVAISDLQIHTGQKVRDPGFSVRGWYAAYPGGLITLGDEGDAVVKARCPFGLRHKDNPEFKGVSPDGDQPHYYAQLQFEMKATGLNKAVFWQWTPKGNDGIVVERDPRYIASMMKVLHSFWLEYLEEISNPDHLEERRVVIEDEYARKLLDQYDELRDSRDTLAERIKEIQQEIVDIAKGKNAIVCGRKLTLVERKGSISYSKVVKENLPADFDLEKYRGKPSSSWSIT